MYFPKKAKTGVLLFITMGPFLVFVFLYLFGNNKFELDSYPLSVSGFPKAIKNSSSPLILFSSTENPKQDRDFQNELTRLAVFFNKLDVKPRIFLLEAERNPPISKLTLEGSVSQNIIPQFWFSADTVLSIKTAKGPVEKRLPNPPRAFLFDTLNNLRGVYGLCNSQSMDTLMLEYKILLDK